MDDLPTTTHEAANAGTGLRLWCHRGHAVDVTPARLLARKDRPLERVRALCACGSIARGGVALLPVGWKDREPTPTPEPFLHRRPKPPRQAKMWAVMAVLDAALTKAEREQGSKVSSQGMADSLGPGMADASAHQRPEHHAVEAEDERSA